LSDTPAPPPIGVHQPPPGSVGARAACGPKASVRLPVIGHGPPPSPVVKSRVSKWRAAVLIGVHVAFAVHIGFWLSGRGGGVRSTVTPVEPSESMATLEMGAVNAGFVFFVTALLSTLVFGRFFCGWGCHLVALQDVCGWMMKKLGVHPRAFRSRLLLWAPLLLAIYMFVWPTLRREVLTPLLGDDVNRDGNAATLVTGLRESLLNRDINGDGRVAAPGDPGDFVPGVSEAAVGRDLNGNGAATDVLPEYAELPLWMGRSAPMPGFKPHFYTEDFWATFASWPVAIPFLLVCGFATVYFMGAKAYCSYGCPYGGFFAPLDRLSPLRIRVNDDCRQCGHCTAVCTSNVRVHEEVRDYGAVIDPGCMKCLDCISVCPTSALRVGLGAPAMLTRPKDPASPLLASAREHARKRYDLSLAEEWAVGAVFVFFLVAYRGMYNVVPLLMAMGIAMVGSYMVYKTWRLLRDRNVRGPFWQLKLDGRVRAGGVAFAAATLAVVAVGVQGLAIKAAYWRGEAVAARIERRENALATAGQRYRPDAADTDAVRGAIASLRLAGSVRDGGIAFYTSPAQHERLSFLYAVVGENGPAERHLVELMRSVNPRSQWTDALIQFFLARKAPVAEQEAIVRELQDHWPRNDAVAAALADVHGYAGDFVGAAQAAEDGLKRRPDSPVLNDRLALALLQQASTHPEYAARAAAALRIAAENDQLPERWFKLAGLLQQMGRASEAVEAQSKGRALAKQPANGSPAPGQSSGQSERGPAGEPPSATR